jgi:hypothetical protein
MKRFFFAGAALAALTATAASAQPVQGVGRPLTRAALEGRVDAGFEPRRLHHPGGSPRRA